MEFFLTIWKTFMEREWRFSNYDCLPIK